MSDVFDIMETTVAGIHEAMRSGELTCAELVEEYARRIEAYDRTGPALKSVILVNPEARGRPPVTTGRWPGEARPGHSTASRCC